MTTILVFNGGSSSIKFSMYSTKDSLTHLYDGEASGIGTPEARLVLDGLENGKRRQIVLDSRAEDFKNFQGAVRKIFLCLAQSNIPRPDAIGHRVAHSGPHLVAHQKVTPEVLSRIEQASFLAPLHEPLALGLIRESMEYYPHVENYACFDTVFHQTLPASASCYPLPKNLRDLGIRRYGFHGLSCESILQQFKGRTMPERMIIAHLGSGVSVTALRGGHSVDTTMGLTPCGGVLMGTRSGDLDPGLILYLLRSQCAETVKPVETLEHLFNTRSGLFALSGYSKDLRELRAAAATGNTQCALAIEAFVLSIKKAVGGFIAVLGGLDALVFTGGIGEYDLLSRAQICAGLEAFGISLDPSMNEHPRGKGNLLSRDSSLIKVYVFPSEENRLIALHVANLRDS